MKNLVYKEIKLSIHSFHWILPLLTGALFLIPNWVFFVAVMYFFWISLPNIFASYNSQNDLTFSMLMPVKKSDYVKAKIVSTMMLELFHLLIAAIYALIHVSIYDYPNFTLDLNFAFFGFAFALYGIFNLVFFIQYFKTGYNFGLATIYASVLILLIAAGIEFAVVLVDPVANVLEGVSASAQLWQIAILVLGVVSYFGLSYITYRVSSKEFESLDL